jgi:tetratricopeptide (TPR) repeat protein
VLSKKNIASQKHYLQKQVCDSLVLYDSRNNEANDIYNQILLIRVYRKKGLLDEAHSTWKKAVARARDTESFALLNLLKTEFEKMILFSSLHTSYDELHSIFKGNVITYDEYAEMIALRDIYAETLLLKRMAHFDLDDALKNKITSLLKQVNNSSPSSGGQSFWFRHYYTMSKATLLYLLNDIDSALPLFQQVLIDWKKNPGYIKIHGEHYIELMYMINYAGILHGEYKYVLDAFNDNNNTLIQEPVQRANFEAIKYLALNKIYNKTAKYAEVEKLVLLMKSKYNQWEPALNSDLNRTVNLSLGIGCFVLENYDDALYFCKRAITYFKDGTREEHLAIAQILLLLITYSQNNSKLFDAQYRTTYTYFYKRKKKHPFETALVQCLHRTFYMTDTKEKVQEYQRALLVFEENKDDVVQQMSFSIFNYPGWLISKVQRISYRQYVERKVKAEAVI